MCVCVGTRAYYIYISMHVIIVLDTPRFMGGLISLFVSLSVCLSVAGLVAWLVG